MAIQFYNSFSRKKEEFKPLAAGTAKIYTCGVTVYDDCHIGHARSLYIFDVIRRYLKYRGFEVTFVRNITDVDDKIINKAKESGTSAAEVAQKNIVGYYRDLASLGIEKADYEPAATEHIDVMVKHIQGLIEKDFAYVADGDVYFNVKKFKDYGKLSGQNLEQMMAGARVEKDERKRDPLDFALWKKAKEGEPSWNSPWGNGRPGWHIECSAMSAKYLGEAFDIHAGGRDLIFPHHENEIAQSQALYGEGSFARYWIHHGLLTINSQKMAKSLGNFITIQDVVSKYPADILKMFYLQAHYASPIDFSWEKMEEARRAYERITILMGKLRRFAHGQQDSEGTTLALKEKFMEFMAYMEDDFNTPRALSALFDMVSITNGLLETNDGHHDRSLQYAYEAMSEIAAVFGLQFLKVVPSEFSDEEIQSQMEQRARHKKEKRFKEADQIRRDLESKGVILEDVKDGTTTWRRKI